MKISQHVFAICFIMFCITACQTGEIRKGAVIMTGNEFHSHGLEIEAELLKKNYDVHMIQVKLEGQMSRDFNWSKSQLIKQFDGKTYDKLLFIAFGHGNEEIGLQMKWDQMLDLVKIFEKKADELFVHIHTCHSGEIVDRWEKELNNKVKVFNTLSCKGLIGKAFVVKPSFVQFITGYWLYAPEREHADISTFKKLGCDATLRDIADTVDTSKCSKNGCHKIHIHRGGDVKMKEWDLLPISLVKRTSDFSIDTEEIPFAQFNCRRESKEFTKTREINIQPNEFFHQQTSVLYDPIHTIKIKNTNGEGEAIDMKNVKPYSTVLLINSGKCDTQNGCKQETALSEMHNINRIKIGYHRNANKMLWITPNGEEYPTFLWDQDYPDDPPRPGISYGTYHTIWIICTIIVLVVVGCIIAYCCCYKKKRQSVDQFRSHAPVEINTPQPHPYPTRVDKRTGIQNFNY